MTLIYVLIGLAVVYAAFAFGRRKQSNYVNQPLPDSAHAHGTSGDAHVHDDSEEAHKQHKNHGGGG